MSRLGRGRIDPRNYPTAVGELRCAMDDLPSRNGRQTDRPRQSTGAPGPGAEVYVDAWHFPPIGETVSMEPAEELLADRRPIDNRHPPNRKPRWRVRQTAPSPG